MEAYKKKVQFERNMGFIIGGLIYLGVILSVILFQEKDGPLGHALGFVTGVSFGLASVAMFFAFRCFFALRDENKLKAMYIKQNDERLTAAKKNAFTVGACISSVGVLIAAIVAMFFNQTVAITLIGVIYFTALVVCICKVIFVKKS